MVKRVTRWLREIRTQLDKAQAALNLAVEQFGNMETLAGEEVLLYRLGHDVTLLREVLEASDPAALRDAWLGLADEKRAEIINAAADAEAEIVLDTDTDELAFRALANADTRILAAIANRLSATQRKRIVEILGGEGDPAQDAN